ncbi:MAG: UvrD-helicase domain-containing protein, partial [Oscillospiraceae bacterium]|nr:UvrD-helicase domain-containing protein [Oscillospiraceae bacterium]
WRTRLEYIMIDEFQDIDRPQYELMKQLCCVHNNLFLVGDPDQTIYSWRGADVRFLLNFPQDFPDVRTILMNENYRSTPEILAAANSLIANNRTRVEKELSAVRPSGPRPVFVHAKTQEAEALRIADGIEALVRGGAAWSDVAVLYRSHFVSRQLEETFLRRGIPYTIYSGVQFFDRAEIKDALSYLRLIAFRDDLSFARVANRPRRNLGESRMGRLRAYAEANGCSLLTALERCCDEEDFRRTGAKKLLDLVARFSAAERGMPVSELLAAVLDESGYEAMLRTAGASDRLDNLAELKQSIYTYETTCGEETDLDRYLRRVALFTNADGLGESDSVRLMTVHAAKGLEFPHVFVCSLEEDVFPSKRTRTREAMEEERRLAFVALTRARDTLTLTDAEGRNFDGSFRTPSRFVLEIDRAALDFETELPAGLKKAAAARAAEELPAADGTSPAFAPGDRVAHPVFGPGTVTGFDPALRAYVIRFDGMPAERKISVRLKLDRLSSPAPGRAD